MLALGDNVITDAVLPVPTALESLYAASMLLGPRRAERHIGIGLGASPHKRSAESLTVGFLRSILLAELRSGLAAHAPIGSGVIPEPAVARRVAEELRLDSDDFIALPVKSLYRCNRTVMILLSSKNACRKNSREIFFILNDAHAVQVGDLHISLPVHKPSSNLAHDIVTRLASAPYANLSGGVSAEHGTILNDSGLYAATGGRESRGNARNTAADNREIGFDRLVDIRRLYRKWTFRGIAVLHKNNTGTTPRKTVAINERNPDRPLLQCDNSAVFPGPFALCDAESPVENLACDLHLECACPLHPAAGADVNAPLSRFRDVCNSLRIKAADAVTVGEQVRRAHDIHELHVDLPSTWIERLGMNFDTPGEARR